MTSLTTAPESLASPQPAAMLQDLSNVDKYMVSLITELRLQYAQLTQAINDTLAAGKVKWSGKRSLRLSMPDLTMHMQQRHDRLKCLHRLLLLVPLHRLAVAAVQQHKSAKVKPSRQLSAVAQMLVMRCSCALPHAKDDVAYLFATFPRIFASKVIEDALAMAARAKKVQAEARLPVNAFQADVEKARALYAKLSVSGLLNTDELATLSKVFVRYGA